MMDYLLCIPRVGPSVREHGLIQFRLLFVCWNRSGRLDTIIRCANCVHPAVRRVADVAIRMLAENLVLLPGRDYLAD
jgi:hypothetical protein